MQRFFLPNKLTWGTIEIDRAKERRLLNQIKRFVRYYAGHKTLFTLDMCCALLMAIADLF